MNLFDLDKEKLKLKKPIRLIEIFSGIGSQAKALKNIGANFEHYRVCEFDKYAVQSYNAIHDTNFETSDVTQLKGSDLGVVETDKYDYILTYSFPCTDLSLAGKQEGMEKGSGTRSGLLWEVERLLTECVELPQVLLMENVPQVHGEANKKAFNEWQLFLESLGYSNVWKDLSATEFGIPQTRVRTFMISFLGDEYYYKFPKGFKLNKLFKDMWELEVEEKYYLSEKMLNYIFSKNDKYISSENNFVLNRDIACTITTREGNTRADTSNFITQKVIDVGYIPYENKTKKHQSNTVYDENGLCPTLCSGMYKNPYKFIYRNNLTKDQLKEMRIRKITPKECFRLMGFNDEDFEKATAVNSNAQLYKQAGNSIVVQVLEAIFKEMI